MSLLSSLLLLSTAACSGSDDGDSSSSQATEEDYNDVAQSLGVVVATGNGGGDIASIYDSTDLAIGLPPLGITLDASGEFNGSRAGLKYTYDLDCSGEDGQALETCGAQTDDAQVKVAWSGDLALPNFTASVDRQGTWRLADIKSGKATFSGSSSFDLDASFQSAWRNIQRDYHLSYDAVYNAVLVRRFPRVIESGSVSYDITASRKASSERGESDATFKVSADLTFSNGNAELVLDGDHRYTVNVATGQVARQ